MKFLIVDDDVVCRKILMIMLKGYGSCQQTKSSEEAVALFRQCLNEKQPYDIVFVEVTLQGTEGMNILQTLRKIEQEFSIRATDRVKCIMTSTASRKNIDDIANKDSLQWDGYLAKPISPELLEKELSRLEVTRPQPEIFNRRQLANLMIDVGDKAIVAELVVKFMTELPEKLLDMQKRILTEEYNYIKEMAHKLVSVSGTYGFNQLSEILRNVEQGAAQSEEMRVVKGLTLATKQWTEIQEKLVDLQADCETHNVN